MRLSILVAFLLAIVPAHADPCVDSLIGRALDQRFSNDYVGSLKTLTELDSLIPDDPRVPFLKAAVLLAETFDTGDVRNHDQFLEEVDAAIGRTEELERSNDPRAPDFLFVRGAAYGYRGAYGLVIGPGLSSLLDGRRGLNTLKDAVEQDPDNFDAYLGLGMFTYWRSKMTSRLAWLPFVGDHREEGIAMIREAAEYGGIARTEALGNLILIYIQEERSDEALAIVHELLEKYPDSRFLLRAAAVSYQQAGALETANHYFKALRTRIPRTTLAHYPNIIHTDLAQAHIALAQEREMEAARLCQRLLAYEIPPKETGRFEATRSDARDMLARINERHGDSLSTKN